MQDWSATSFSLHLPGFRGRHHQPELRVGVVARGLLGDPRSVDTAGALRYVPEGRRLRCLLRNLWVPGGRGWRSPEVPDRGPLAGAFAHHALVPAAQMSRCAPACGAGPPFPLAQVHQRRARRQGPGRLGTRRDLGVTSNKRFNLTRQLLGYPESARRAG